MGFKSILVKISLALAALNQLCLVLLPVNFSIVDLYNVDDDSLVSLIIGVEGFRVRMLNSHRYLLVVASLPLGARVWGMEVAFQRVLDAGTLLSDSL